eukprot:TRINITY_DN68950_c0_g1_i3.p1 TRINITY_DN68950_c0_g1~~TRINITY_DN68950_c0_g1_i3.p1  ORF type:complete len:345 (-),score=30.58 TRINITY_DN68950_c0_g1_i3:22-1056(-)
MAATSAFISPQLVGLTDRVGRKSVLVVCLIGSGMAAMGQGVAWSYWSLFAFRSVGGVFNATNAVARVYLTDVCSKTALPRTMSSVVAMLGVAQLIGSGVSGALAGYFGLLIPVIGEGFVIFVFGMIVAAFLPESPSWLAHAERASSDSKAEEDAVSKASSLSANIYLLVLCEGLRGVNLGVGVSMLAILLQGKFGFDAQQTGYMFAACGPFAIAGSLLAPRIIRSNGIFFAATLGIFLDGAFSLLMAIFEDHRLVALARCASAFSVCIFSPAVLSLPGRLTVSSNRGKVQGMLQMASKLGQCVGPCLCGLLAREDCAYPFYFKSGVCFAMAGMCAAMRSRSGPL